MVRQVSASAPVSAMSHSQCIPARTFRLSQNDVFIRSGRSRPGDARAGELRRGPLRWNRRSTSWPASLGSIRWHCVTGSIQVRCGVRNGVLVQQKLVGTGAIRRVPIPERSNTGWAWRNRSGVPMSQCVVRGPGPTRRFRAGVVECAGLRHGNRYNSGPGGGGRIRFAARGYHGAHTGDTGTPVGAANNTWQRQTTASITPAARAAAWTVKQKLFREVAVTLGTAVPEQLAARDGKILGCQRSCAVQLMR